MGEVSDRVDSVALARFIPLTALPQAPRNREDGVRGVWGVRGVVTSAIEEAVDVEDTDVEREGDGAGIVNVPANGVRVGGWNVAGV